jgi:hypothetical protein
MKELIYQQPIFAPITPLGAMCEPDVRGRCLTCSDDVQPATLLSLDAASCTALVEIDGTITEIDISLVDDAAAGETLLVHGGVALEKAV